MSYSEQCTWLYNLAFVLYPPVGWPLWDENDHGQMMNVTLMFAWNIALVFIVQASWHIYEVTTQNNWLTVSGTLLLQIILGITVYRWVKINASKKSVKKCDSNVDVNCESEEELLS